MINLEQIYLTPFDVHSIGKDDDKPLPKEEAKELIDGIMIKHHAQEIACLINTFIAEGNKEDALNLAYYFSGLLFEQEGLASRREWAEELIGRYDVKIDIAEWVEHHNKKISIKEI